MADEENVEAEVNEAEVRALGLIAYSLMLDLKDAPDFMGFDVVGMTIANTFTLNPNGKRYKMTLEEVT